MGVIAEQPHASPISKMTRISWVQNETEAHMNGWIGRDELGRLSDQALYGLQKLLFRALSCPQANPADLSAIRATLTAIEAELECRSYHSAPPIWQRKIQPK